MARAFLKRADDRLFGGRRRRYSELLTDRILPECQSVLDVGCGAEAALMDLVSGIPYSVGVDVVLPQELDATGTYHNEYRKLDVRTLSEHFPPKSFDCVVALDVIEHLETEDGFGLLRAMESIASKRVIVFTPNGFLFQPPEPDNPYQEHISGWDVDTFLSRGYQVTGVNGWKPLRGTYSRPTWAPRAFWGRVSLLTQKPFETRPRQAFQLLCTKDLKTSD